VLRVAAAAVLMLAVAAIVYVASHGHVYFFPLIVILGLPLAALLRKPN
jgi:hypothetical protein